MASPTPPHHHHHFCPHLSSAFPFRPCCCAHHHLRHQFRPHLSTASPFRPCCFCCAHHHHHHHLLLPSIITPQRHCGMIPRPGIPPPLLPPQKELCSIATQGAEEAGDSWVTSEGDFSNRLLDEDRTEELEDEGGEEGEQVFVLTDEWAEFFAKSEAKRRLDKKQKRESKQKKGSK